jgi:hypothetical protein
MNRRVIWCLVYFLIMAVVAQAAPAPGTICPATDAATQFFASLIASAPRVTQTKDGCFADLNCPSGAYIHCSSGTPGTCTAGSDFVEYNGTRTDCPACSLEKQCCDGSWVYCQGSSCFYTVRGVNCDGVAYRCPFCTPVP